MSSYFAATSSLLDYCSYSSYKPNHMFMESAVDDECRFGHHLQRQASDLSKIRVVAQLNLLRCYFSNLY